MKLLQVLTMTSMEAGCMHLLIHRDSDEILLTYSQCDHRRSCLAQVVHKAVQINIVIGNKILWWKLASGNSNNLSVIANMQITTLETYDFEDFI